MSAPALQLTGVVAGYSGGRVLNGVDLSVGQGEVVALLGRNGMGKTTLCRVCMGMLPASRGVVQVAGADVTSWPIHRIARLGVGYVPQGRQVFDALTVAENLRLGAVGAARQFDEGQAFRWFPALAALRLRTAGTLSGGEQQMVAIARALMGAPKLLVLDEPSEGLAPAVIQELGQRLRAVVAETGLSVLLVEQQLALVRAVAASCAFLVDGAIAARESVAGLPASGAVQRYLGL